MYRLEEYGDMIADKVRIGAYCDAIQRAVRPGDVVVDLGSGPGIFTLLACRAGAKRVYAIDSNEAVHLTRQLAAANGFGDRVEVIRGDSRQVRLPERANVLVSDIRGVLPLFAEAIPVIEDARRRFVTERGVQIPRLDTLYAAIIEAPELHDRLTSPWKQTTYGLDLTLSLSLVLNGTYNKRCSRAQLLTEPQSWHAIDYSQPHERHAAATLQFRVNRKGVGHGIVVWFDTELFDGVGYSSGPAGGSTVYGQLILPWLEPVSLAPGCVVALELHADAVGGDYVWRWDTAIQPHGELPEHVFRQSTFLSAQFSKESLRRRSEDFVPALTETGEAEKWVLQAMDGVTPLLEIVRAAVERFPRIFPRPDEALRHISSVSDKFSR